MKKVPETSGLKHRRPSNGQVNTRVYQEGKIGIDDVNDFADEDKLAVRSEDLDFCKEFFK